MTSTLDTRVLPGYDGRVFGGICLSLVLPGICNPCLAAIQQTGSKGIIDCNVCLHGQIAACRLYPLEQ